jgi:hypothetical protein
MHPTSPQATESFYRAAFLGLRLLEAREGRGQRFGETADARWKAFAGALEDRDRLDLVIRAASVTAPLAFAPRTVFALEGLAGDEPFGPRWQGPPKGLARELFRSATAPLSATGLREALDTARACWGLPAFASQAALVGSLERLSASSKVLVSGASASMMLGLAAQGRSDLDLGTQAVLVADGPAERQLWGVALMLLQTRGRGLVLGSTEATPARVRALGFARVDICLVSDDAETASRESVRATAADLPA